MKYFSLILHIPKKVIKKSSQTVSTKVSKIWRYCWLQSKFTELTKVIRDEGNYLSDWTKKYYFSSTETLSNQSRETRPMTSNCYGTEEKNALLGRTTITQEKDGISSWREINQLFLEKTMKSFWKEKTKMNPEESKRHRTHIGNRR